MLLGVGYKLQAGWSTAMNIVLKQIEMQPASLYRRNEHILVLLFMHGFLLVL